MADSKARAVAGAALWALAAGAPTLPALAQSAGGITGFGAISLASGAPAGPETCAQAAAEAEARYGLPGGLLTAIATVESGRYDPALQANLAWPWTINAEGAGAHFDSKAEAIAAVEAERAAGKTSIDVGCMQINLHWHPDAFVDLDDAFDPALNADYAARLLTRLLAQHGDWPTAIGYYHSPTDWRQADYQAKVADAWSALGGNMAATVAAAAVPAAPSGPTLFGGLVAAGGPGSGAGAIGGLSASPSPVIAEAARGGPSAALVQQARALGVGGAAGADATPLRFFPLPPR
ncbi:MAG: lytic transglycosylase domain-containing protein [Alphaproteobacteria bacterium]